METLISVTDLCTAASRPHSKARICSIKSFFTKSLQEEPPCPTNPLFYTQCIQISSRCLLTKASIPNQSVGLLIPQEPRPETGYGPPAPSHHVPRESLYPRHIHCLSGNSGHRHLPLEYYSVLPPSNPLSTLMSSF